MSGTGTERKHKARLGEKAEKLLGGYDAGKRDELPAEADAARQGAKFFDLLGDGQNKKRARRRRR